MENIKINMIALGIFMFLGLIGLGKILGDTAIKVKEYERTVRVKGLSEKEYPADIVIWPLQFTGAANVLEDLYSEIDKNTALIKAFLIENKLSEKDFTVSAPAITDKSAQQYGASKPVYRYTYRQTVNVYSRAIEKVRAIMFSISTLGKKGIVFSNESYYAEPQYLFTRLNEVKPEMVEEATKRARNVAEKFAADSQSRLGKIKRASQGQFSISSRDKNNPHIKKIRIVSTIEYYLAD